MPDFVVIIADGGSATFSAFSNTPATGDDIEVLFEEAVSASVTGSGTIDFDITMTVDDVIIATGCVETFKKGGELIITGNFELNRIYCDLSADVAIQTSGVTVSGTILDTTEARIYVESSAVFFMEGESSSCIVEIDAEGASGSSNFPSMTIHGTLTASSYFSLLHLSDIDFAADCTFTMSSSIIYFDPTVSYVTLNGELSLTESKFCSYGDQWYFAMGGSAVLTDGGKNTFCDIYWRLLSSTYDFIFTRNPTHFRDRRNKRLVIHEPLGCDKALVHTISQGARYFTLRGIFERDDDDQCEDLQDMYDDIDEVFEFFWDGGYVGKVRMLSIDIPRSSQQAGHRPYTIELVEVYE